MSHSLVEGDGLRKAYGLQVVLDDLSFMVTEGQKIALIGRNGAGKSTLLRIMTGVEEADDGEVRFYPQARIGVVEQHSAFPEGVTALAYLESGSGKPEWEVRKLGAEFGLHAEHLDRQVAELSGGYRMRVKLVKMLLAEPNLLLLDEPVNYLDLQTLLLLERFLASYKGAFILAAHDRTFLQHTCTHTFEIERGALTSFRGPVDAYFAHKKAQVEFTARTNKKLAREIAHQQAFVDRFRAKARQATQAQSRMKHIKKLRSRISKAAVNLANVRITIPVPYVVPGEAVHADGLAVGYGAHVVAERIAFDIQRGEKAVIAGENGRGKSTLMKTLAGVIPPLAGKMKWWHKADIGYYDQMTERNLDPDDTILGHLTKMAEGDASSERILMMAGNFLFRNADLDKRTGVLSGGERARLSLAGILLGAHNVLLLDEPTNHLDVETTEALAVALKAYPGTVIVISHSRTFVDTLVDKVYEIREGTLRRFMGSYEDYVGEVAELVAADAEDEPPADVGGDSGLTAGERAEIRIRLKEHQRAQDRAEKKMKTLDKEKSEILAWFFEHAGEYEPKRSTRLAEVEDQLSALEKRWLEDQARIDELRDRL